LVKVRMLPRPPDDEDEWDPTKTETKGSAQGTKGGVMRVDLASGNIRLQPHFNPWQRRHENEMPRQTDRRIVRSRLAFLWFVAASISF